MLISVFREIDELIKQANTKYDKQKTEEALDYLRKAIQQDPRHPAPYLRSADIYDDLGEDSMAFEYRLLASHLDSKTSGADWAYLGEIAINVERLREASACYGNGRLTL
jgi:tetratricopeptide (TPR) repeat protein